MKIITPTLYFLAATLLFGCSTAVPRNDSRNDYAGVPATEIIVTVSCSDPSTRFAGTIVSDGHTERLSGTGGASFRASGHAFVCSFKKLDPSGSITISVSEGGEHLGRSTTALPSGGVRAEVVRTPRAQNTTFTTF